MLDKIRASTVIYYSLLAVFRSFNARLLKSSMDINAFYWNINIINV
jgi:hypothetical protein